MSAVSAPEPATRSRRVLDPSERSAEVLFGVIMVLTFTGSLSAATSGREEVRTMLIGAVGCNLAWGIVDAIMYLMGALSEKGRRAFLLGRVLGDEDANAADRVLADNLPPLVASVMTPEEIDSIRRRLAALPAPPRRARLTGEDWKGALGVFLLVFLSTFPIVIPFLVMREAMPALRVSNAIAIVLLYLAGQSAGRYAGFRGWTTGLAMVGIGVVLVAITMALGG
jgi:VIT1/CCC1 family predicted Fe2+/Mn2+ transporter